MDCICAYAAVVDDTNKDGIIDRDELGVLLLEVELEASQEEISFDDLQYKVTQMFSDYDKDGSGAIDFLEFLRMVFSNPQLFGTATMLRSYFVEADEDNDKILVRRVRFVSSSARSRFWGVEPDILNRKPLSRT